MSFLPVSTWTTSQDGLLERGPKGMDSVSLGPRASRDSGNPTLYTHDNGTICFFGVFPCSIVLYTSKVNVLPLNCLVFGLQKGPFWEIKRTNGEVIPNPKTAQMPAKHEKIQQNHS